MAYKHGDRNQITFLPVSVEDYVPQNDPVRVYDAFIDALDMLSLGIELDENKVGNSNYYPVSMLKILVYSYSYGWRSSRKIERALHHNLSFIWLAGGLKPDHKTISNFRKNHKDVLKNLLKQCARICLKINLIEGNTLFVDGSKIRANAGKRRTKSNETWEQYQGFIEARIEELLNECEDIDQLEYDNQVKIASELCDKEKLNTKIKELLCEMKDEGLEKINSTDPDSRIMKSRQGSHSAYNCQIVADEANGLIVSIDANTSMNDLNQLTTQIENAEESLGVESEINCADAGYSSVNDLKTLVDRGKTVIVPDNKQASRKKTETFDRYSFNYNAQRDCYICPVGHQLHRVFGNSCKRKIEYRHKGSKICISCKHFGKCTTAKTGKRVYRHSNKETKEKLAKIYESQYGQEVYTKRKMLVEHPFGHIKHNLGVSSFLLRRLDGVKAEFSLMGTCFNISRMITLLGGVGPAIKKMKQITLIA